MALADIMSRDVQTCRLSDSIEMCAKKMAERKIGFLPVVDDEGKLMGTLTDRDITLRAVAKGSPPDTRCEEVFSDKPVHVHEDSSLQEVEEIMANGHIRRIVVVDGENKPTGMISVGDITRHETDAQHLRDVLNRIFEHISEERTVEKVEAVCPSCI